MTKKPLHWWAAWILALLAWVLLAAASVLLYLYAPWKTYLEVESGAFWLDALVIMGAPALGLLIALRQHANRYGWLWLVYGFSSSLIAITAAIYYFHGSKPDGYPLLTALLLWSYVPALYTSLLCYPLLMLWFPNGQLPSPRWRFLEWWLVIDLLLFIPAVFGTGVDQNFTVAIKNPLGFIPQAIQLITVPIGFFSVLFATFLAALSVFYRYRHADSVERQQLKWFILGGAGLASEILVLILGNGLFVKIYNNAMLLLVYITIGIAILRYRLYDVDVIIRRTLVYSVLTLLLAFVYFGGVTLLQSVFTAISGQQSALAIVLSTLAIAALFNPLRKRVQEFVDRRFYRRKYDAEQALASFAALAREEVDLEEISARLLKVVEETVQPEHSSLWLRRTVEEGTKINTGWVVDR